MRQDCFILQQAMPRARQIMIIFNGLRSGTVPASAAAPISTICPAVSLTKALKRTLDTLAQAHAAVHLAQHENSATVLQPVGRQQPPQVALVAEATLPDHLLDYALDTCRHFQAGLLLIDTLPQQAERLHARLGAIVSAEIPLTVTPLAEASLPALHALILDQPRLLFVIVGADAKQTRHMQWHSPVPLLVVSEQSQHPATTVARTPDFQSTPR